MFMLLNVAFYGIVAAGLGFGTWLMSADAIPTGELTGGLTIISLFALLLTYLFKWHLPAEREERAKQNQDHLQAMKDVVEAHALALKEMTESNATAMKDMVEGHREQLRGLGEQHKDTTRSIIEAHNLNKVEDRRGLAEMATSVSKLADAVAANCTARAKSRS